MDNTSLNNEIYEEEKANIINTISDGWYNLLAFYEQIDILSNNQSERRIVKSNYTETKNTCENEFEYDMKILYNERDLGVFSVIVSNNEFNLNSYKDFALKASVIRKHSNNNLLPPGLLFIYDNKCIWSNAIADEIIFMTDLNISDIIMNDSLSDKENVYVNNYKFLHFDLLAIKIPIISKDKFIGYFVILADNALNNKRIKELTNKTAVIKEIHHRVKNNLQTISSLLSMQMRRTNNKIVQKTFTESINRINSIALVHEELSKVGIEKVNIKTTITSIMETLLRTMAPPDKDIKGKIEGSSIYMESNKASSLSLCVSELIQNSIEHAFKFRKKGSITVNIKESGEFAFITIEDDGIGFTNKKGKDSLGLDIVEMITNETLKGTFSINGHLYGTQIQIKFPII
jgi:two-component sensor histidine kinase